MNHLTSVELTFEGQPGRPQVSSVRGIERLHEVPRYEVAFRFEGTPQPTVDAAALIGGAASLRLAHPSGHRTIHGIVRALEVFFDHVELCLEPRLSLLGDTTDHQTFLAEDAVSIVRAVATEHDVDLRSTVSRTLEKQEQRVQIYETDLAFLSHTLAEEGIFFFVSHDDDKDEVVLCDEPSAYPDLPGGPIRYADDQHLAGGDELVTEISLEKSAVVDQVTLRDWNFEKPAVGLEVEDTAGDRGIEHYEWPAGHRTKAEGKTLARLRLEEARCRKTVLRGTSNSSRLAVGHVLTIEDAPRADLGGRFLLVELTHDLRPRKAEKGRLGNSDHVVAFTAIPADVPFRPARAPRPSMGGVETAVVTGPSGQEIHTDEHARTKVRFRHERRRKADDTSSHWARTMQPPTSGGAMVPRVGWEVLLTTFDGAGDAPLLLGRLANGVHVPPEKLPGGSVVSAFGTSTTPGGGSGNLLKIDDTAGAERVHLVASRDLTSSTANDHATFVTGNEKVTVGSNLTSSIGARTAINVTGPITWNTAATHTTSVKSNQKVVAPALNELVVAARMIDVLGDHKITALGGYARRVGGVKIVLPIELQTETVNGGQFVKIGAGSTILAGTGVTITVHMASTETIDGSRSITGKTYSFKAKTFQHKFIGSWNRTAAGDLTDETTSGSLVYRACSGAKLNGSEGTVVRADDQIVLEARGAKITITPDKITIDARWLSKEDILDGDIQYEG